MKIPWTVLKLQNGRDFVLETATYKIQRGITQKVHKQELWFLRSACRLMLVNICMKFHEGNFNGFWVTERTRPYRKIYYFQFQRATTPKIRNPELRFLRSARRLMLLYICIKFHENISKVALHLYKVSWKYLKRFLSYRADTILWQTDGRTDDQGKNNMSPNPTGGDITIICQILCCFIKANTKITTHTLSIKANTKITIHTIHKLYFRNGV